MATPVTPKVQTAEVPWKTLVVRADPDFEYHRRHVLEYEFTGHDFYSNPTLRGAYAETRNFLLSEDGQHILSGEDGAPLVSEQ